MSAPYRLSVTPAEPEIASSRTWLQTGNNQSVRQARGLHRVGDSAQPIRSRHYHHQSQSTLRSSIDLLHKKKFLAIRLHFPPFSTTLRSPHSQPRREQVTSLARGWFSAIARTHIRSSAALLLRLITAVHFRDQFFQVIEMLSPNFWPVILFHVSSDVLKQRPLEGNHSLHNMTFNGCASHV